MDHAANGRLTDSEDHRNFAVRSIIDVSEHDCRPMPGVECSQPLIQQDQVGLTDKFVWRRMRVDLARAPEFVPASVDHGDTQICGWISDRVVSVGKSQKGILNEIFGRRFRADDQPCDANHSDVLAAIQLVECRTDQVHDDDRAHNIHINMTHERPDPLRDPDRN